MHLEPPPPPHTIREFLREYGMIVLSVLTALLLEHVAVDWGNRTAAAASEARIRSELQRDLVDLRQCETINQQGMAVVKDALKPLLQKLSDGDKTLPKLNAQPKFSMLISMPSWQRSAWDTAIADRSAEHMNATDLSRFASAYTAAQDLSTISSLVLSGGWFDQGAGLLVDIQSGSIDLPRLTKFMMRYLIAAQQMQLTEQDLEKKTVAALER